MGEDESGDLKTLLKHKIFIKIYTMCLKDFNPWKDFSNENKVTLQLLKLVKNESVFSLLKTFCETFSNFVKREKKKLEWKQKNKIKEGWK